MVTSTAIAAIAAKAIAPARPGSARTLASQPPGTLCRTVRKPPRQQGVRVGVGIGVLGIAVRLGDGVRLGAESSVQSLWQAVLFACRRP